MDPRAGRIMPIEKSSDLIRIRSHELLYFREYFDYTDEPTINFA
jgi:hypothetical protein